jgi:hypothetical protein
MLGFEALTDTPIGGEMRTAFRAAKVRRHTEPASWSNGIHIFFSRSHAFSNSFVNLRTRLHGHVFPLLVC